MNPERIEEALAWADSQNHHHHRCASKMGGECDCYQETRADHRCPRILAAALREAQEALRQIAETARWYADNGQRDPHEVDHALCVEILSLAENAVSPPADEDERMAGFRRVHDDARRRRSVLSPLADEENR